MFYNKKTRDFLTINFSYNSKIYEKETEMFFSKTYMRDDILSSNGDWIQLQLVEIKTLLKQNLVGRREFKKIVNHVVGSFHDFKRNELLTIEKTKDKYIR